MKYGDCVAKLHHCLPFPSLLSLLEFLEFLDILGILGGQVSLYLQNLQDSSSVPGLLLSRQVSLYLRPVEHLFAILENSTLRRHWNFLRQVSLNLTNLFDKVLLSIPGLFDAIGLFTVEEFVETETARFIVVGFDLASILLSPFCSCILFARAQQRAEMADVKQIKKIVPLMACEIPFCQYVCKLVFGVDVPDLNFLGSRLSLSNNQSSATLWVQDTCLIVGLRPLRIILITASLSSKMYIIAPNRENFAFDGTQSTLFRSKL